MLRTASTGHLHRHELPYGVLLHRLFLCQKISRIQNRVTSLYESELTVTLSGTTVKGCKLQDTSSSETPGSAPPREYTGTLAAATGGLRCPANPAAAAAAAAEHTALHGCKGWAAVRLLPPLQDLSGRGRRGESSGKLFWGGPEGSNSANAEFCSVVIFAARSAGGSGSFMGNISPFDRQRA